MLPTPVAQLLQLHGKVALVTGGATGIGSGIALRLAEAGATIGIADSDSSEAEKLVAHIAGSGGKASSIKVDVCRIADAQLAVQEMMERYGRLDILVNNAGIYPFSAAIHVDEHEWDRVLGTNLKGTFFFSQVAGQCMIKQGRPGRIVNIGSISSIRPVGNLAHYDASKGGVVALTKSLALEFAQYGITVNAVLPGEVDTPGTRKASASLHQEGGVRVSDHAASEYLARIPLGRLAVPDDVAKVVLFLVSTAANYVTGSCLTVDGGLLLT